MAADPKAIADFTTDLNPVSGSELGRGISRGILQVGEGLAGFGEIFADLVGADTAKAWLKTQGNSLAELSRNIPRAVESFTQIRDIPSLGAYAAAAIGELVPQIGVSFGAGLAARGAAVGGAALVRGMAGAGAASYSQEAGSIYRGIREETGQEAPKTALAFGAPAAALDTLLPARFLGKVFDSATDELKSKAWTSLVKRSFVEAAKAAPIEGLTEGAQEAIAISANRFADSTYDAINGKNFIRVLDAGLQGVIGGALVGSFTPAIETAVKSREEKVRDDTAGQETRRGPQTNVTGISEESPLASMGPETAPTFYSRLQRTVETSPQQKASGAQWKATIKQSKLGANADEMALVGVDSLEDEKPYTKQDVLTFLKDNEIQVREVTYGGEDEVYKRFVDELTAAQEDEYRKLEVLRLAMVEAKIIEDTTPLRDNLTMLRDGRPWEVAVRKMGLSPLLESYRLAGSKIDEPAQRLAGISVRDNPHYSQYQLGGGEEGTYREWVLSVPTAGISDPSKVEARLNELDAIRREREWTTRERHLYESTLKTRQVGWSDGHSAYADIPNPIVRLRGAVHTTTDGKRMLLIEEVQAPAKGQFEKMPALFQAKWRDIGFKFALRKAAELGADTLGWTTGAQQAERYNLSKHISDEGIRWSENHDGTIQVRALSRDTGGGLINQAVRPDALEATVGKEVAKQITDATARGIQIGQITGDNLKVGGAGLIKLYDIDFRNVVNNLPSVKKAGVKVRSAEIETDRYNRSFAGDAELQAVQTKLAQIRSEWNLPNRTPAGWNRWNVTLDRQADNVIKAMQGGTPYAEAMQREGSPILAQEFGGKFANFKERETVHAIPIPDSLRASVLEGQPLASVAGTQRSGYSLSVPEVQSAVVDMAKRFGVTVEVLPTPPAELGPKFTKARGYVYPDGRVQLYANNIFDVGAPGELFFHEVGVHLGLQAAATTPTEQRELAAILNSVAPRMMAKADEIAKRGSFENFAALATRYGFDMTTPEGRQGAVAELLAREAQRYAAMKTPPSWWRAFIGKLKAFLGRIFRFDIGDDGVYAIITKGLSQAGKAQQRAVVAQNATTQQPLASLGPTLTAKNLRDTIAFTSDPAIQRQEAIMASGQTTGLFDVLKDHFAALANRFIPPFASDRTKRLERAATVVNVTRLQGIEDAVTALGVTPQQFDDALRATTNAGEKATVSLHWWNWFNLFEAQARKNAAKLAAKQQFVLTPGFQQKIRNARGQLDKADVAHEARRLLVAQLKNGLAQAQARAGQAGVNEALFATANEQVRFYTELLNRVDPIERRMREIIVAANNNPAFFQAIIDGTFTTPEELLNAYLATSPRLPGPGPEMVELRVAADVLHRTRQLALRMTAAEASEDTAVAQAVTDIESKVRHSVDDKNFREVVNNVLRKVVSLATAEGKATAIFKITQRPLVRQMELLEALEFGDAVFNATMADPRYVAMRNRANELVGAFPVPAVAMSREKGKANEMAVPLSNPLLPESTIIMPNGERRLFKMLNSQSEWASQMPVLERTLDELTDWLVQNPDDPFRGFYAWEHGTLNAYWHSSVAQNPPNMEPALRNFHFKLMDVPLKELDSVIGQVGGRAKQTAVAFEGILKDSMHLMQEWTARNLPNLTRTIVDAVKSHPEILEGQSFTAAAEDWYYDVLNPLFVSHRDPTRTGYRVGEVIPHSGYRVTREDMLAAQRQAKSTKDAHAIDAVKGREKYVTQPLVEDQWIPGVKSLRRVATTSAMMVPRHFGRTYGVSMASEFIKDVLPDSAARDNAPRGVAPTGRVTAAQFWRDPKRFDFVRASVIERNAEYNTPSTFEDAFRDATAEMQRDWDSIHDMDTLVQFVAQRTTATPDEIEAFIVSEMNREANAFINSIPSLVQERNGKPLEPMTISQWEQTNSFTTGRGKAIASSAWYEYGFKDARDILNFSMSGNSFFHDQYVQALREIARNMQTYKENVIQPRIKEIGQEPAFAENRAAVQLGNELLRWESVDDYIIGLNKIAAEFNKVYSVGGREVDLRVRAADVAMSRLVGGVLFNWIGTLRNAHESGGFWNGVRLSRLEGSIMRAFPRAAYHLLKTTILVGRHAAPAAFRAVGSVARNLPGAARTALSFNPANWLKAEGKLFGEAVDMVSDSLFGVRELNDQLNARGIGMTVTPNETVENMADLWESGGVIREVQSSTNPLLRATQTLLRFLGTAADVQLALFARPFAPRIGDRIANEAIASSTLAALKSLEKRLRKLAYTMQQSGVSPVGHRFTANEIFRPFLGFDRSMSDIRFLEQWFADSNVDFHQSVAEWFTRLQQDPKAEWLTAEDKWRLAVRSAEAINVATGFNRALAIKANFFTRMIGLLMGWNLHAYRQVGNYLGRSTSDDKSAFRIRSAIALWTLAVLAASAGSAIELEWLIRMIARLMGEPERATRLPLEWERGSDQAKSLLVYSTMNIPFIASAVSSAFNDLPNRASLSPYTLAQNQLVRVLNYIGGAVNSGDPTFGLAPLVKGFVPGASVVLNRLPYAQGLMPALDSTRLITRYADKDSLRRPFSNSGPGASANITPLSPFGDRILSAIGRGDDQEAERLYAQAVQVAKSIGKQNPESAVRSMVVNRLPISRSLKSTPTAADYQRLLGRMSPYERAKIEAFTVRAEAGLSRLGVDTGKLRPIPPPRTTGTSTRGRTARSRSGYRTSRVRRVRLGGSRSRLGTRRRRNSLVRQAV